MTLADVPPWLVRVVALLFGLVWGSFSNVVIHRLPRRASVVRPASRCPACSQPIAARHNIPVVSWLWLRGRARCCGARISPRYPLVEAIGGTLSMAIVEMLVLPLPLSTPLVHALSVYVAALALAVGLTCVAFIDLEHMIVPDSISLAGTVLGLLTFGMRDLRLEDALLGALVGFVVIWLPFDVAYRRLRGRAGMGLGDAKLLMLAGAWFGWVGALFVLGAAAIQGALVVLIVTLARGRPPEEPVAVRQEREQWQAALAELPAEERDALAQELAHDPLAEPPETGLHKARVAFGPFLVLGALECLLLGPERILRYLSLE